MLKKNFKIRVVLTFVTMLVMAMMLQSIVVMFLGVRAFIQEDVAWAVDALERETLASELTRQRGESNRFSCTYVELAGVAPADQLSCRFRDKVLALSRQASEQNKTVTGFAGSGWNTFLFGREVAIIAVPLVDKMGQVVGTIAAERSLLPIYARYKQDVTIVLSYLLVNALLFSSLSFFRILHLFFRPLDNLVQKAESYRPDVQTLFLTSDNESPFRKLSSRLSTLFDRIERDNLTLRQNLRELEAVNAELKERNELVARSEKLATAGRLSAGLAHEIGNPLAVRIRFEQERLQRDGQRYADHEPQRTQNGAPDDERHDGPEGRDIQAATHDRGFDALVDDCADDEVGSHHEEGVGRVDAHAGQQHWRDQRNPEADDGHKVEHEVEDTP